MGGAQLRTRVDAQFLGQRPAYVLVAGQGFGPVPGRRQESHGRRLQPLVPRCFAGQHQHRIEDWQGPVELECADGGLGGGGAALLLDRDELGPFQHPRRQPGECRRAGQPQGLDPVPQAARPPGASHQVPEPGQVRTPGRHRQPIAGAGRAHPRPGLPGRQLGLQSPPQPADQPVDPVDRGVRRVVLPQHGDQILDRHHMPTGRDQLGQHQLLLRRPGLGRHTPVPQLQAAEHLHVRPGARIEQVGHRRSRSRAAKGSAGGPVRVTIPSHLLGRPRLPRQRLPRVRAGVRRARSGSSPRRRGSRRRRPRSGPGRELDGVGRRGRVPVVLSPRCRRVRPRSAPRRRVAVPSSAAPGPDPVDLDGARAGRHRPLPHVRAQLGLGAGPLAVVVTARPGRPPDGHCLSTRPS